MTWVGGGVLMNKHMNEENEVGFSPFLPSHFLHQ
jgi:hypothetical protein